MSSARFCLFLLKNTGFAALCLGQTSCSFFYVAKQGYYQMKLLCSAKDIQKVLQKPEISPTHKQKLQLVLDVKKFSEEKLGFFQSRNYQTVSLDFSPTLYNVSASLPLQFSPYTWWFPVVGTVPYKGFFDKKDAIKEKDLLEKKALDVALFAIPGYSSLGYFADPLWPSMLNQPDFALIQFLLHELAHATLYFPGHADFNESFATAASKMGSLKFAREHYGPQSPLLKELTHYYADEAVCHEWRNQLYDTLHRIYESSLPHDTKKTQKDRAIAKSLAAYDKLPFTGVFFKHRKPAALNNAHILSFKRYYSAQAHFENLLQRVHSDWKKWLEILGKLKNHPSPLKGLEHEIKMLP